MMQPSQSSFFNVPCSSLTTAIAETSPILSDGYRKKVSWDISVSTGSKCHCEWVAFQQFELVTAAYMPDWRHWYLALVLMS